MKLIKIITLLLVFSTYQARAQNTSVQFKWDTIVVSEELTKIKNGWSDAEIRKLDYMGINPDWTPVKVIVNGNTIKLTWNSKEQKFLRCTFFNGEYLIDPGADITINYGKSGLVTFSGTGSRLLQLQYEIRQAYNKAQKPTKGYWVIETLADYLNWDQFLNNQLSVALTKIAAQGKAIPANTLHIIKSHAIYNIEFTRAEAFMGVLRLKDKNKLTQTGQDLVKISDSTLNNKSAVWLNALTDYKGDPWYFFQYNRIQTFKLFNFDLTQDSVNTDIDRRVLYLSSIKQRYRGLLRERLLQFLIADNIIKEIGYEHPFVRQTLNDYYRQKEFPQYKAWMRAYEKKAARLYGWNAAEINRSAPDFRLEDVNGNLYSNQSLKGKITVLDFWFTGCTGCVQMTPELRRVEQALKNDTDFVFLSVSVDKDRSRWKKSIAEGIYTTGSGINLFTGGKGTKHPMIVDYNIYEYPQLFVLDDRGNIKFPVPDPRKDHGSALITELRKLKASKSDGPYVFYSADSLTVQTIASEKLFTERHALKENSIHVSVSTDRFPEKFNVTLRKQLAKANDSYDRPDKLLVLSDIEGNFDALRRILTANRVIDEKFNWIFGDNHLVCLGDFMDRGQQVTECLWLIYALEEKAKVAGGTVHFIVGNHEVMNLQDDHRYVQPKYRDNADKMKKSLAELYGIHTELGRWMRTKNVIEKVGDLLFCHAGVSADINKQSLSLPDINRIAIENYDNPKKILKNSDAALVMNTVTGPLWYRGYYKSPKITLAQVDSTLVKFQVSHIVTGHTIVSDTVSSHYNGKVFNTDTPHERGSSEALLIEGKNFYRVNDKGQRWLLLDERKKKVIVPKAGER